MATTGSSMADGMYSKLIDDEGAYDDVTRRPDVGLCGKVPPQSNVTPLAAVSPWRG